MLQFNKEKVRCGLCLITAGEMYNLRLLGYIDVGGTPTSAKRDAIPQHSSFLLTCQKPGGFYCLFLPCCSILTIPLRTKHTLAAEINVKTG
jgi:hypothetical protein